MSFGILSLQPKFYLLGDRNCSSRGMTSLLLFLLVHWVLMATLVETQHRVEVVSTLVEEVVDTRKILPTLG